MPYTGYTPVWVISNCYAERCRTGFYGGSTTPSTKFISCTAQYGATGFNLVGTSYAESCIANNCTTVGFIPNSSYMKGNATNSCAVGIQCNSYNTFGFVGVYDHISIGDVVGVQQSQYSQNVYLSNCSFTTPTNYAIDKVLTAGLTVCNGCTIDIPSLSKAYHVVTGVNYGIEHYRLQNSFGKNGLVWPNASALQDTTTTPYSLQLVFNGTSGLQYAPFVVGSTYGKSSTAYTVSINYWAPIGSWSGTMIPYLKLNGVTIITGSTISSITATPVTLTFNVTAGMMTDDGQLTIEVVPNCNSVATNWGSLNAVKVI